jgi:hypothetical protein
MSKHTPIIVTFQLRLLLLFSAIFLFGTGLGFLRFFRLIESGIPMIGTDMRSGIGAILLGLIFCLPGIVCCALGVLSFVAIFRKTISTR